VRVRGMHLAVFDTAFRELPAPAATYAIDADLAAREGGVRRFGAHGIRHEYVASEAARHLDRPLGDLSMITMHLGNGASVAAFRGGRPLETSMEMTPLEGLVMGTKAGDIDAGVIPQLIRHDQLGAHDLDDLLNRRSGLLGLTAHGDFRDLLAAADRGDAGSIVGYMVYCHRLRKYIEVEPAANAGVGSGVARISPPAAEVDVLVVPRNEELAMARAAVGLLRTSED